MPPHKLSVFGCAVHTVVQEPQCAGSFARFTHDVPHTVPLHVETQVPLAPIAGSQSWPEVQVVVPASQRSAVSLHVSVPLQLIASAQVRAGPDSQAPSEEQASLTVQYCVSSHGVPAVAFVHVVVDVPTRQVWHWLSGLMVSGA